MINIAGYHGAKTIVFNMWKYTSFSKNLIPINVQLLIEGHNRLYLQVAPNKHDMGFKLNCKTNAKIKNEIQKNFSWGIKPERWLCHVKRSCHQTIQDGLGPFL